MHHIINAIQCPRQTILITDIANNEAYPLVSFELLSHLPLLHLVTGINNQPLGVVFCQGHGDEGVAERTGAACNEDG